MMNKKKKDIKDPQTEQDRKLLGAEIILIIIILAAILVSQLVSTPGTDSVAEGAGWEHPEDLKNGRFVITNGSAYDVVIRGMFPDAERIYVNSFADESIMVEQGKADAFMRENSSLPELKRLYPDLVRMEEPVSELDCHWCTQKTPAGKKLRDEVNAFLAEMQREDPDFLNNLYKKWEDPDQAPDHIEDFPMTGDYKGKLRLVASLDWPPLSYQSGKNPCGYSLELAYRFCAWAGYEPVFEFVEGLAALSGFEAGKYDLYAYGIQYNEEGAETKYYTDVFLLEPVYLIVRRENYAFADRVDPQPEAGTENVSRAGELSSRLRASFEKTFIREERWKLLLSGLGVTIGLSVFSVLFGTVLGALICAMRMSRRVWLEAFSRIYIKVLQGTPIVMLLMILYYIIFGKTSVSAFWVCVLGFSLDFSAYASEIFRSGIEAVPSGQFRAAKALGFKPVDAFLRVVLPQSMLYIVPVYIGQLISTVKLTSVAGYISVEDLTRASDIIRSRTYEAFFPLVVTAIIYFLVALLLTRLLKIAQHRVDPMSRPRTVKGVEMHDQG